MAPAFCSESADWPMTCSPPLLPHLQDVPPWSCSAFCFVAFELPASAVDDASFDCETSPSSPGLRTRTAMFSFDGFFCSVVESAAASCSESADCPMTCSPPLPQQLLPACSCSAVCSVPFALPADASEDASLDCDTSPPSPGLSTRTGWLSFDAPCWSVNASASAS